MQELTRRPIRPVEGEMKALEVMDVIEEVLISAKEVTGQKEVEEEEPEEQVVVVAEAVETVQVVVVVPIAEAEATGQVEDLIVQVEVEAAVQAVVHQGKNRIE